MSDKKPGRTPEQIVDFVVSNGRLAGLETDAETLEVVRKIAYGDMSADDIEDWQRNKVLEIRKGVAKDRLKLKYLPVDFDLDKIDEYERYLSMSDEDQKAFVADMPTGRIDFWIDLETSRALYVDPVDRQDGSITEAKVARYPDRYGWNP